MEGQPAHQARQQPWRQQLRGVVTTRAVWPAFWVDLGMVGSMLAFVGLWAIPYLRDVHGLERSAAAAYTTMALAGFALGSLGAGWFSDRIGRRRPVIVVGTLGYALTCASFAFIPWTSSLVGMALFAMLGFFSGGFIVTFAAAKEVVVPSSAGMAVGLVNTGLFIGAAGMQPLFGWAMDLLWQGTVVNGVRVYAASDYRLGFLFMFGCALLAVAGAVRVRETHCRNLTVGG
jgi:MFS family permease